MSKRLADTPLTALAISAGATVGGAETLMKHLALRLAARGIRVTFLTTCAENHLTWENALPPGTRACGPIEVPSTV